MSRFFETIQLLNGELKNLEFHQERFENTRSKALGLKSHPLLSDVIEVPDGLDQGLLKCRVSYAREIELIEYEPQLKREVNSLQLVYSDTIEYGYKYADRTELEKLFGQREECDDILIVKNNLITDSYYANVVFWNGESWITPDRPLLPGTMRASLLSEGEIREGKITREDLDKYQRVKLINAMNELQVAPEIPIDSILRR
jgi:4-amino-4-deoxychorismate lyase